MRRSDGPSGPKSHWYPESPADSRRAWRVCSDVAVWKSGRAPHSGQRESPGFRAKTASQIEHRAFIAPRRCKRQAVRATLAPACGV
jgi:hypothetical protein